MPLYASSPADWTRLPLASIAAGALDARGGGTKWLVTVPTPDKLLAMTTVAGLVEQYELISDDPRVDADEIGPIELWRAWRKANADHPSGLITRSMAAHILGVSSAQVAVWCNRGKLTDIVVGPARFVDVDEVKMLCKVLATEGRAIGGRGKKAPTMAEVLKASVHLVPRDE